METEKKEPFETESEFIEFLRDGSTKIILEHELRPYEGSKEDPAFGLKEIKLRKPYVADLLYLDKSSGDIEGLVAVCAKVASLPRSILERMAPSDFGRIVGIVSPQLKKFQMTSESAQDFWLRNSDGPLEKSVD